MVHSVDEVVPKDVNPLLGLEKGPLEVSNPLFEQLPVRSPPTIGNELIFVSWPNGAHRHSSGMVDFGRIYKVMFHALSTHRVSVQHFPMLISSPLFSRVSGTDLFIPPTPLPCLSPPLPPLQAPLHRWLT